MVLEAFLTEKPPVACTTILVFIFSTGLPSSTQGASIVTFMRKVV